MLHDDHAVYLLHAALVAKVLLHAKVCCVEIAKTNSVLATSSASAAAASSAFSKQPTKSPDIYFAQMQSRESVHCRAIILFRGNHNFCFKVVFVVLVVLVVVLVVSAQADSYKNLWRLS